MNLFKKLRRGKILPPIIEQAVRDPRLPSGIVVEREKGDRAAGGKERNRMFEEMDMINEYLNETWKLKKYRQLINIFKEANQLAEKLSKELKQLNQELTLPKINDVTSELKEIRDSLTHQDQELGKECRESWKQHID